MSNVTIRELRHRGGEVVDRVAAGERVTITRSGTPVAELRPVRAGGLTSAQLLGRWRRLPSIDARMLRAEIDDTLDPVL